MAKYVLCLSFIAALMFSVYAAIPDSYGMTSVCAISTEPSRFDGKRVMLRARVETMGHYTVFVDKSCRGARLFWVLNDETAADNDMMQLRRAVQAANHTNSLSRLEGRVRHLTVEATITGLVERKSRAEIWLLPARATDIKSFEAEEWVEPLAPKPSR